MHILMLYPEFPETFWGFRHALRFIGKRAAQPPLGLLTVAALLPESWNIRLVDCNVEKLRNKHIDQADYVFISAMSIQKWPAKELIARCKARGARVVAGGPLFTAEPELFPEVDHLLTGEGELTIPRFLRDLAANRLRRRYDAGGFADITRTPPPRWDLLRQNRYAQRNLQYSRGCPYNCDFCDIGVLFGRGVRTKTADQVVLELEELRRSKWRGEVFFVDDNFIGNRPKLRREILPAIAAWMQQRKRPFSFGTEVSINLADDKPLMEAMVEAGFDSIFVGIESVSDEALSECGKQQNRNRSMIDSVQEMQRMGLEVTAGFILGFDSDTPSVFQRISDFIQESGIATAMVGLLNAPRDTALYKRMQSEGRLLDDISGNNTDGTVNFVPAMGMDTLVEGYREVLRHLYAPRAYYARVRQFMQQYQPGKHTGFRLKFCHLWALASSMVRLGILGRERRYYWSLLGWTLVRRPGLFPMAVTFSIYGFHYRMFFSGQV